MRGGAGVGGGADYTEREAEAQSLKPGAQAGPLDPHLKPYPGWPAPNTVHAFSHVHIIFLIFPHNLECIKETAHSYSLKHLSQSVERLLPGVSAVKLK